MYTKTIMECLDIDDDISLKNRLDFIISNGLQKQSILIKGELYPYDSYLLIYSISKNAYKCANYLNSIQKHYIDIETFPFPKKFTKSHFNYFKQLMRFNKINKLMNGRKYIITW